MIVARVSILSVKYVKDGEVGWTPSCEKEEREC